MFVFTDSSHGGSGFPSSFSGNVVTQNVANVSGTNLVVYFPTTGQPGYGNGANNSGNNDIFNSYTFVADAAPSPTTTLTASQNPSLFGGAVTFSATVAGSGATPTGTVTFKDGSTVLGTATLNASGVAYYGTSALTAGTHSITAVYSGDGSYSASTSSALSQNNTGSITVTINNPSFETQR